jgi:RNA polymerase sigma-70 factor (ECF subfamily)
VLFRSWKPLYLFARRQGTDVETANDLTQAFFERVLEKDYLKDVAPEKGRFRNWILAAMRHFLSDARERERALKRGGGKVASLDVDFAERLLAAATDAPEKVFARTWAMETLDRAMLRLRIEWDAAGRAGEFQALARHLRGETGTYGETAEKLGLAEHDIKNMLHGMRKRLRGILREEVAESVEDPREIDAELAELFSALAG